MGYYTTFSMEHDNDAIDDEVLVEELRDITGYGWDTAFTLNEVKWYDWKDHMKTVSTAHPGTLFTLGGTGEENSDMWVAYFKSGKMKIERAVITFGQFDESKLK